jgi:hypothetical protein
MSRTFIVTDPVSVVNATRFDGILSCSRESCVTGMARQRRTTQSVDVSPRARAVAAAVARVRLPRFRKVVNGVS